MCALFFSREPEPWRRRWDRLPGKWCRDRLRQVSPYPPPSQTAKLPPADSKRLSSLRSDTQPRPQRETRPRHRLCLFLSVPLLLFSRLALSFARGRSA
ncbi:hypothetical protein SKAU_G00309370 [Synaphobranchus kaupii]|uniref:Uncharacterized protein n=1 Tax=Synaphobranchus kaupii TaxID=118154 RepID=A0A9Q1ERJ4_SYNKA|nr:hypothetical protein SKAU_G00309370 [Synaphobranchus kaupii]